MYFIVHAAFVRIKLMMMIVCKVIDFTGKFNCYTGCNSV